jgi:dihydrofolate reductase
MRTRTKGTLLVAMDKRGAIGYGGALPWDRCREDMALFRLLTSGGTVIMGRRTHEGLGKKLPDRVNLVLTKEARPREGGTIWMPSIEGAHHFAEELGLPIHYIGGETVYRQALDLGLVDTMYMTTIETVCEHVDAWFPTVDLGKWEAAARMDLSREAYVTKYTRKREAGKEAWQ